LDPVTELLLLDAFRLLLLVEVVLELRISPLLVEEVELLDL
jgi:hypothetical protein